MRYLAKAKVYSKGRIIEPGEIVEHDGQPAWWMEPLDVGDPVVKGRRGRRAQADAKTADFDPQDGASEAADPPVTVSNQEVI